MTLERGAIDLSSMFGIVQPGSKQARINLARQQQIERDRVIREIPLWERPDPNRKPPAGIIKAK